VSQKIPIKELKPHADNAFFFDDITGDAWDEFVESIKTSGVIEPIVITQDKVIVSGHQRVRACKALGIDEIEAEVRIIDSEDEVLKQLIETNIRQRGIGNTNPVKFGRCLDELKRIYGIHNGGVHGESLPNYSEVKTNEELASSIGISVDTMENYIKISKAIPEIQSLVETGIVTPTTARAIIKKLPKFQQEELAKQWIEEGGKKLTGKEVNEEIERLKAEKQDLREERDYLQSKLEKEQSREPEVKVVEKKVEVMPKDYEKLKEELETARQDMKVYEDDLKKARDKADKSAARVKELESKIGSDKSKADATRDIQSFTDYTNDYLRRYGGHVWAFEKFDSLPESVKADFVNAIKNLDGFAQQLIVNLDGKKGAN